MVLLCTMELLSSLEDCSSERLGFCSLRWLTPRQMEARPGAASLQGEKGRGDVVIK